MAKKKNDSVALILSGAVVFALGAFVGYGIVIFAGAMVMIAGLLPQSKNEQEDESDHSI